MILAFWVSGLSIMSAPRRRINVCSVCYKEACICKQIDTINAEYDNKIILVCKKCYKHKCICQNQKKKPIESEKGTKWIDFNLRIIANQL